VIDDALGPDFTPMAVNDPLHGRQAGRAMLARGDAGGIPADSPGRALPLFTDKRVRIFGHDDEVGRGAVERWAGQLASVGADLDSFNFAGLRQVDGKPVKDLNDSLLMDTSSFAQTERMLP
jgi:hypothetical protein